LFLNKKSANNNEFKRFGRFSSDFLKVVDIVPELLRHLTNHVKPGGEDFSSH